MLEKRKLTINVIIRRCRLRYTHRQTAFPQ